MKYEVFTTLEKGYQLPPWATGFDRLSYNSPYPGRNEQMQEDIADGSLSRYCDFGDWVVHGETFDEIHTIYNLLPAAEKDNNWCISLPPVISSVIIERPEL